MDVLGGLEKIAFDVSEMDALAETEVCTARESAGDLLAVLTNVDVPGAAVKMAYRYQ
jgi:hypothetical protein